MKNSAMKALMDERPRPPLFPVSLQMILIISYVGLIIVAVGVSGFISFRNGQQAVNDVAQQMRHELIQRVNTHLSNFLDAPHHHNQFTESLIQQSLLNPAGVQVMQHYFLEMVKSSPTITSVYFGNPAGGIVGSGREGSGGALYVYSTSAFQSGAFSKSSVDANGTPGVLLSTVPNFDARLRPWYGNAVKNATETWSEIYILFTGQDLAIASSRPVYATDGQLLGVLSVDLFLSQISQDLQTMGIPSGGSVFIVDQSGYLVATSTREKMFSSAGTNGKLERIRATDSPTKIIQETTRFTQSLYGDDYSSLTGEQLLDFDLAGERQFVQLLPFTQNGLQWVIVVVLPESLFMKQIKINNLWTLSITVLTTFLAILLSIFVASKVTERIAKLDQATQALASGDRDNILETESRILELKGLETSFKKMHKRLYATLDQLTDEIQERKVSEAKYRSVIQQAQEGFDLVDENGLLVEWNQGMEQLSGIPASEAIGHSAWEIEYRITPLEQRTETLLKEMEEQIREAFRTRQASWLNQLRAVEIQHVDGSRRFVMMNTYGVSFEKKFMLGGVMHDITSEKLALQEKETLLRELYHRTKNNMQVISSLLALEKDYTTNPEVLQVVQEMRNRIDSMAMVHEKLYQSRNLSNIDLAEYLRSLAELINTSYSVNSPVEFRFELESIPVSIDVAIPCGLILNELISNALKYAFPASRNGQISISLQRGIDKRIKMMVADNGVGFPVGFDPYQNGKLGIETVFALSEMQLQGTVDFQVDTGVTFVITFFDNQYSPRI